jgi:hypothetical protein
MLSEWIVGQLRQMHHRLKPGDISLGDVPKVLSELGRLCRNAPIQPAIAIVASVKTDHCVTALAQRPDQ